MKTYKRRHEQFVTAAKFEGGPENAKELCRWMGGGSSYIPSTTTDPREYLQVPTPFGPRDITAGNWVVRTESADGSKTFLPYKDEPFNIEFSEVTDEESYLVQHARVELDKFPNEDPEFVESIMDTVKAFSKYQGHSGSSQEIAVQMVTMLLNGFHLLPLTDDPEEWELRSGEEFGMPVDLWQSKRNSRAMTDDPELKKYWMVGDLRNEDGSRIYHDTEAKDFVPEIDPEDLKSEDEEDGGYTGPELSGV